MTMTWVDVQYECYILNQVYIFLECVTNAATSQEARRGSRLRSTQSLTELSLLWWWCTQVVNHRDTEMHWFHYQFRLTQIPIDSQIEPLTQLSFCSGDQEIVDRCSVTGVMMSLCLNISLPLHSHGTLILTQMHIDLHTDPDSLTDTLELAWRSRNVQRYPLMNCNYFTMPLCSNYRKTPPPLLHVQGGRMAKW